MTSIRQQQLAKLTPAQLIELSYLSALLEQQPFEHSKPLSDKVAAIREFLEKIVQITPIESIGYAVAYGNSYVAKQCIEAIEESSLTLSSALMSDAMRLTSRKSLVSLPHTMDNTPMNVICGLNLESLYPVTSSIQGLTSPIDTLQSGRNRLSSLMSRNDSPCGESTNSFDSRDMSFTQAQSTALSLPLRRCTSGDSNGSSLDVLPALDDSLNSSRSLSNSLMLQAVNQIRQEDLATCIALITGFINQQEIDVPLLNANHDQLSKERFGVSVWSLSNLGLDDVHNSKELEMTVRVEDFTRGSQFLRPESLADKQYAGKVHFLVQAMQRSVSYNSQHISYSLERQLVNLCQDRNITDSIPLNEVIQHWDKIFEKDILSLVAKSHRPLVARWLYWSLMVHDLREELAKYTAVGVVGLVNSGKSGLVSSLFSVQVSKHMMIYIYCRNVAGIN